MDRNVVTVVAAIAMMKAAGLTEIIRYVKGELIFGGYFKISCEDCYV